MDKQIRFLVVLKNKETNEIIVKEFDNREDMMTYIKAENEMNEYDVVIYGEGNII